MPILMENRRNYVIVDTPEAIALHPRYLHEEGPKGAGEDVTSLIRRNPIPAILAGIGFGLVLAKLTTRG